MMTERSCLQEQHTTAELNSKPYDSLHLRQESTNDSLRQLSNVCTESETKLENILLFFPVPNPPALSINYNNLKHPYIIIKMLFDHYEKNVLPENACILCCRSKTNTLILEGLAFTGTFDSTYTAHNFTLRLLQKQIFEASVVSNQTMTILYTGCERVIKSSSMNNITDVGLLYFSETKMLYVCVNYIDQGWQNTVSAIDLSEILKTDIDFAP